MVLVLSLLDGRQSGMLCMEVSIVLNCGYSIYLTPRRLRESMARMLVASKNPEQATAGPLPK
jgi:hypothetical protein